MELNAAWSGVQEQLQIYEPLIRRFLQGDIIHPEWVPPHDYDYDSEAPWSNSKAHVDRPRMLKFGEQDRPDMLLYGLGSLDQVDIQFAERLNLFMSHDEHTHVICTNLLTVLISVRRVILNTSGTGKTRMVFELLSRAWGLYFTCSSDQQSPYGSADLGYILTYMEGTQLCGHPSTWQQPLANNIQRARQALNNVITARLLIFGLFYDLVQLLRIEEQVARQKWLLLQLRSDIIFGTSDDLFDELRAGVSRIDPNLVEKRIETIISTRKFPLSIIAIDEGNVASKMHKSSYAMSDGSTLAPVLREVVRHFSSSFPTQRLIVSGTRIDMNVVTDAIENGSSSQSRIRLVCSLGSFDTVERTRHYVQHFLGPVSKAQVARMHSWFQGRHRFLANCVEHMLMLGLAQLDAFIQMAVVSLTGFDTNNVEWELGHLYGLIREDYELSGSFAARHLQEALFAYTLRNQQTSLWSDVEDHVSLGLALLDDDATHASIWEPLVFYRLFTWFLKNSDCGIDTAVKQQLHKSLRISHSLRLVNGLASYLYRLHAPSTSDPIGLSDYLDFRGAIPGWADATAEIVLPPCTRAGHIRLRYPTAFSITAAKRPDDVLDWLNGGDHPFLIPDDGLGADLMFFLRLKHVNLGSTAVVLVTLQLARPSRSARRDAKIVPIQPAMFYPKANRHRSAVISAIRSLPRLPVDSNRAGPQSLGMLRVLCSADPFRPPTKRELPVACLQVETIVQRSHEPELDVSYLHRARRKQRHELEVVNVS
ncbi:hypothetical protein BKA62DRAFT_834991 [Auriculariales sp. MPI-PUGE-AT-0066]|nr:hypothetical protein BKA62DRAFT_834991 [Auriculariales sp. MPI-PUGE-AT-0066]